ncbi:MAG TPA: GNAT family N-acetyltransferase [Longimicrobiaceae bacterium]|nr:GNAT family N-acetyltransferase [Longimicrobiaceae bacterium]
MPADPPVRIHTDLRPGDLGAIVRLHGVVYAAEYGWDHTFEAMVAQGLAAHALSGDVERSRLWIAERDGEVAGCIAIVGQEDGTAQLRWFVVDPDHRGAGIGRRLLDEALAFCRERGFRSVFLWTVRGLNAAAHLYRTAGFAVTQEETHVRWGATVTEQRYDLKLDDA